MSWLDALLATPFWYAKGMLVSAMTLVPITMFWCVVAKKPFMAAREFEDDSAFLLFMAGVASLVWPVGLVTFLAALLGLSVRAAINTHRKKKEKTQREVQRVHEAVRLSEKQTQRILDDEQKRDKARAAAQRVGA